MEWFTPYKSQVLKKIYQNYLCTKYFVLWPKGIQHITFEYKTLFC